MPFCPRCECEYRSGVGQCPDCQAELVETLPSPTSLPQVEFTEVELRTIQGEIHAKLLQGVLGREGIASRLAPAQPLTPAYGVKALWPIGGGYDESFRIMVNETDLARAQFIRDDYDGTAGSTEQSVSSEEE